ncbi:MAG: HAMP domain-containing sensor histidine kinase, partial [Pseudomonadota bacterium]
VLVTAAPSSEGRSVVFSVRDDGPGIAPDRLERLFMPFAQGDRPGGAGLGLAIARGIALGHGGTLVAESTPGEGATFRLMLPRTPPAKSGARASSGQSLSADLPR